MHTGTVYLIHAHGGLDNRPGVKNRHYLGFTANLPARLDEHARGQGSAFMRELRAREIDWSVARVWNGVDRSFERRLKNRKNAPRMCPVCATEEAA